MPFEIVRNDIANMKADAIVNTADHLPRVGCGVDYAIHKKAGPRLLQARKEIGTIPVGEAAVTPAYGLDAKYVIHAVTPTWREGGDEDRQLLRKSFDRVLHLAAEYNCESVAFPLLSAGNRGFPRRIAMQTAVDAVNDFLMEYDIRIYLVVFDDETFRLSGECFDSVACFIDENYIHDQTPGGYGRNYICDPVQERRPRKTRPLRSESCPAAQSCIWAAPDVAQDDLDELLKRPEAGFSETLLKLIDRSGKKDPEIYKRANVDKRVFSRIRNDIHYKPSKSTAIAFAIALELSLEETADLLGRAGFALSRSSKFDIIIEYFIANRKYNIFEINEALFDFGQHTLV